ncbi:integral membrane regulatory protein [Sphaerisporangium melleum]|uniref:Integral membrane regulatory protein n=1 Tax=Sphaerisporangium melleum TaxID=321316 RepID=A0A917VCT1_9ACTN|nr:glycosyltransferase family 2 protein [Sphaerisporangium melleum]GGK65067.1 integral membrane regulatory protein [Sphaerisporangium melleum]GII70005.1 integral membrane regulatory protein [Sphaerisporangium melleum]
MQPPRPSVTAIVVSHDGARWLKETLQGVLRQSRPLDRLVGVDNGSRDGSAALLTEAFGANSVLTMPRSTGFGEAVAAVLERLPHTGGEEWIWLLHDDCAPDRHALEALLWAAAGDREAVILGPKIRDWLDRRTLLEVGVTVDRSGRRDTALEPREYDQGQHDGVHEVLSVSTAGMLVRRDVWERLGGLDPELPLFRDDLDLCWRATAAGHKVLCVTAAVAWHAEAAARRRRRMAVSDTHPRRLDRRNAMFVVMANLPFRSMLWSVVRNLFVSLLRTLLLLLAKQPANALDEVVAFGGVLSSPRRLLKARKARKQGRKQGYPKVKALFTPPGMALRRLTDMVQGYLSGAGPIDSAGRHHAVISEPSGEDDGDELLTDAGLMQRVFGNPGVLLCLGLLAVTIAAERSLLYGGLLGGGALVPVVGGASDLWQFYTSGYHAAGLGSGGWAPPYVAVLAALSTIFLGKTWLAVSVLLLGCVPLAGLSAYIATRSMISHPLARVWLAASYALLPVATGAVAAGRLGTAVVFVLLPAYAALAARVITGERRRARRAAWALGLLLAVGTAFAPLVYVLVAVLGGLAAVSFGGVRRGVGASLGIAMAVPIVLLAPWLAQLAADPGRILLEAGLHRPELVDSRLPPEALLLLSPGGPGVPPVWVTGGLFAAALAALLFRRHQMVVVVGWGVTVFGVLVATVAARVPVGDAPAWPGVPLAFAATGLIVAAALTGHRVIELHRAGGLRRVGAALMVLVACASPVLVAGLWIKDGVDGPLRRGVPSVITDFVAAASRQGEGTIVLRSGADGLLTFTVLRGRTPLIGETELPVPDALRRRLSDLVAGVISGRGGDDAVALASYGVRFVAVPGPVDAKVRRSLDADPALTRVNLSPNGGLWRMVAPLGRVYLQGKDGGRTPVPYTEPAGGGIAVTVPPGEPGRTLVLAEPAGGWTATAGGSSPAARTIDGWAQGFEPPAAGGRVTIEYGASWHRIWLWAQLAIVVLVLVLASPGARGAEITEEYAEPVAAERELQEVPAR